MLFPSESYLNNFKDVLHGQLDCCDSPLSSSPKVDLSASDGSSKDPFPIQPLNLKTCYSDNLNGTNAIGLEYLTSSSPTSESNASSTKQQSVALSNGGSRKSNETVDHRQAFGSHEENLYTGSSYGSDLVNASGNVSDLLMLEKLDMDSVLINTKIRYFQSEIYTAVGPLILISVNPYTTIPKLYTLETASIYYGAKNNFSSLPPHLYRVAQSALTSLFTEDNDQAIVISGESGAGKTEATKIILGYLAALDYLEQSIRHVPSVKKSQQTNLLSLASTGVERQIIQSNPILESFGNAKTLRNDNSSRFGKFTQLFFDLDKKCLISARIFNYLLEKSRLIGQVPHERNYHVFYQLLCGYQLLDTTLQHKLALDTDTSYSYLSYGSCNQDEKDANDFKQLLECLHSLHFAQVDIEEIFSILAGILHLGNVNFHVNGEGNDELSVSSLDSRDWEKCCELFGLDQTTLSNLLFSTTIVDASSQNKIILQRNSNSAITARDSLCKAIYERLFHWIVDRLNTMLYSSVADTLLEDLEFNSSGLIEKSSSLGYCESKMKSKHRIGRIGLLDIFGFEIFDSNSFEQLCINYANEQLQQHFNSNVLREEQSLYQEEGIKWDHILFEDNKDIIDALTNKVYGVFSTLDSECLMPCGCDGNFLQKVHSIAEKSNVIFLPSKLSRFDQFGIRHYAGPVNYLVDGMVDKNRDLVYRDFCECFQTHGTPLLKKLFEKNFSTAAVPSANAMKRGGIKASKTSGTQQNFAQSSVSFTFRAQLSELMERLQVATASYIKCIKPNSGKIPKHFDTKEILRQFECAGMLESIRIRKTGYAIRVPIERFFRRYRALFTIQTTLKAKFDALSGSDKNSPDFLLLCKAIRGMLSLYEKCFGENCWGVGRTKIFLKENLYSYLEQQRVSHLNLYATKITAAWRRYRIQQRYNLVRDLSIDLQGVAHTKIWKDRFYQNFLAQRHAACIVIQNVWKQYTFLKTTQIAREAVDKIATAWIHYKQRQPEREIEQSQENEKQGHQQNLKISGQHFFNMKSYETQGLSSPQLVSKNVTDDGKCLKGSDRTVNCLKRRPSTPSLPLGVMNEMDPNVSHSFPNSSYPCRMKSKQEKNETKQVEASSKSCLRCEALEQDIKMLKVHLDEKKRAVDHVEEQKRRLKEECTLLTKELEASQNTATKLRQMNQTLTQQYEEQQANFSKVSNEREYLHLRLTSLDKEVDDALENQKKRLEEKFSESLEDQRETLLKQIQMYHKKLSASEETINSLRHLQKLQRNHESHDIEDHPLSSLPKDHTAHLVHFPSPLHRGGSRLQTLRKESESGDLTDRHDTSLPVVVESRTARGSRGEASLPATYIALKEETKESQTLQQEMEALRRERQIIGAEHRMLEEKTRLLEEQLKKEKDQVEYLRTERCALEHTGELLKCEKKHAERQIESVEQQNKVMQHEISKLLKKNAAIMDRLYRLQQHQKESDFKTQLGVATTCDVAQQKACTLLLEYQATLRQKKWKHLTPELIVETFQAYIHNLLTLLVASPELANQHNHTVDEPHTYTRTPRTICVTHRHLTSRRSTGIIRQGMPDKCPTSRYFKGGDTLCSSAAYGEAGMRLNMACVTERLGSVPMTLTERSAQHRTAPRTQLHTPCHPLDSIPTCTSRLHHRHTETNNG